MSVLRMPQAGKKAQDATVLAWHVREGSAFMKGELLLLLETIEGRAQGEAAADGTLQKILCRPGQTAAVGDPIAEVLLSGEEAAAPSSQSQTQQTSKPMSQPSASGPVTTILMPQAGNSMEEGTILSWKVKVGDRVKPGDVVAEIETDKSTMEVEATEEGRIARLAAAEGDVVPVKEPIAYLAEDDADLDAVAGGAPAAAAVPTPAAPAASSSPGAPVASAPPAGSVTPIPMPQAGNSMEEGTILSWMVKEGDRVTEGQEIAEIETDKSTMALEAPAAGRVAKLLAAEGDIVAVKEPVALLAENDADADAYVASSQGGASAPAVRPDAGNGGGGLTAPPPPPAPVAAATAPAAKTGTGRVKASPVARRFAKEMGVELVALGAGSGPGGRILSTDVQVAAKSGVKAAPAPAAAAPSPAVMAGKPVRKPMTRMRKAIGKALTASKQTVPHFYVKATIDADPLFAYYKAEKAKYKVSVNDILVKAIAQVCMEMPAFRTRLEGDDMVEYPAANIGIAVGIEDGLLVPVLVGANQMNFQQIGEQSRRIVEGARNGKAEAQGQGVFTISNMGMFGVDEFSAIINPPESGILAVGAIKEAVVVKDGMMRPGRQMTMVLSCDHRVVDGANGARFCGRLRELLENPETIGA